MVAGIPVQKRGLAKWKLLNKERSSKVARQLVPPNRREKGDDGESDDSQEKQQGEEAERGQKTNGRESK